MDKQIPSEVRRWSWGAFLLTWIWGIFNGVWISLLCLIPIVNIFMVFALGVRGKEWAWESRRWESIDDFLRVQRKWDIAGFIFLGVSFLPVLFIILYYLGIVGEKSIDNQVVDYNNARTISKVTKDFHSAVTGAVYASAAAPAGQTTNLNSYQVKIKGFKITTRPVTVAPSTRNILVILSPTSNGDENSAVAESLANNKIHGCGNSGGCIARVDYDGNVTYYKYSDSNLKRLVNQYVAVYTQTQNNVYKKSSPVLASTLTGAHFRKLQSGITSVGDVNAGQLIISHHGEWLITTLGSKPVSYGHNFGSIFQMGKYDFFGEVDYNGLHYWILRDVAGGGQDYIAKWQIARRDSNGNFLVTKFFGTGASEAKIKTKKDKILIIMSGPKGLEKYSYTMDHVHSKPKSRADLIDELTTLSKKLDDKYNVIIASLSKEDAYKFQQQEIRWIIQKRSLCGTYKSDLQSTMKSGLKCQVTETEKRINLLDASYPK